ncbi:MAG: carboxypeptidase regulatory-like domain-containing protein [Salibacteraceae bacterium]
MGQSPTTDSSVAVAGQVVADTLGNPIPYAHLTLKLARSAATTDGDGRFRYRLPLGDTLVGTAVGFVPTQVPVHALTAAQLTIQLEPDTLSLPTHTVVGYTKWRQFQEDFADKEAGNDTTDVAIPGVARYRKKRYEPPPTSQNVVSLYYETLSPHAFKERKFQRMRDRLRTNLPEGYDLKDLPQLYPEDTLKIDSTGVDSVLVRQ